ncbi:1-phosphofructokinase family hexose kinase [Leifsonia naganoensis]|uniref:1-phosphofructokinase family hexose kinase n=1 Tax=Leifsonia naganoensis TaxID=150025 RepID=A0A853DTY3_9MICO|nr:hexose kinase [Leifsonia naganoensis]NYK09125.1 1-phosphofructokinase family hexose kinase [Leifsonia naganoensis]
MTESERDELPTGWPSGPGATRTIAVVGPNPAMDRTEEIEHFRPHEVNRAAVSSPRAGGKSFIVARALRRLGDDVTLYGFLGGATGSYLRDECARLGIRDRHTAIADDTRINTILVDERTRLSTVINEPGPQVSPAELRGLTTALATDIRSGDLLVLTGSLPRGADDTLYADLVVLASQRGALSIVDAEGETLVRAAAALPWAVKCNLEEFLAIAPDAPERIVTEDDRRRLVTSMQSVARWGIQLVIVTLGADGLVAVTKSHAYEVVAAAVETKNATGSGDTFLAGFVSACAAGSSLPQALQHGAAAASANAAVLVPDIGPEPRLDPLLRRTRVRRLASAAEPSVAPR